MNQYLFVVFRVQITAFIVHFILFKFTRYNQDPEMLIDIHLYTVYQAGKASKIYLLFGVSGLVRVSGCGVVFLFLLLLFFLEALIT